MVHIDASANPTEDDATFVLSSFRTSLSSSLLDAISQHLLAIGLSLLPTLLFLLRLLRPSCPISSRLIRSVLSLTALLYFPSLALCTSIVIAILFFLLRHTRDVEALLHRLCRAVIQPVVDRLSAASASTNATLTLSAAPNGVSLSELHASLRASADAVRRREAVVARYGRRSPLRALVRVLTAFGIRAAFAALACVTETRFRDAINATSGYESPNDAATIINNLLHNINQAAAITNRGGGGWGVFASLRRPSRVDSIDEDEYTVDSTGNTCDNSGHNGGCRVAQQNDSNSSSADRKDGRLSRSVVIAILRAEMVSSVLLPFEASVKMYLYGTLVVAALLTFGPIWLLR